MIICDRCKKIPRGGKSEPFLYEIVGTKMEETKTGKRGTASGREIVKIAMHLCDHCISMFNRDLGFFCHSIRNDEFEEMNRSTEASREAEELSQLNAEKLVSRESSPADTNFDGS